MCDHGCGDDDVGGVPDQNGACSDDEVGGTTQSYTITNIRCSNINYIPPKSHT